MVCAIDKVTSTSDLATELHNNAEENDRKHNKVLVFSQYKAVARAIHNRLGHESLCSVDNRLNSMGTMEREELIQRFQNDSKIKYLVTTLAAKEGHDITEAGIVIFNDLFWTPANHEQCEGRAYMRINDPHGIDSYYQIIDMGGDSVEEWIWEMLERKMKLIETIVDGVEGARDVSIASELIAKFKESMNMNGNRRRR
jgi:SNF2 family DNA or RNA helicase